MTLAALAHCPGIRMSAQPAPLDLQTLRRFVRAVRDLLTSEVRRKAIALLLFLLAFALSVNGLNVVNSYVGRDFMTAIAHRDMAGFVRLAILYVGVFAATTAVAVLYRFTEERLGLLWRAWLTRRVTGATSTGGPISGSRSRPRSTIPISGSPRTSGRSRPPRCRSPSSS